jgi:hypothetical protein
MSADVTMRLKIRKRKHKEEKYERKGRNRKGKWSKRLTIGEGRYANN